MGFHKIKLDAIERRASEGIGNCFDCFGVMGR
jgi:hypothetical protein